MPVACEARWDICAFRRGLGFRWVWAVCSGVLVWGSGQRVEWFLGFRIQLRRFKGLSLYIEFLRGFSTEVMTIEEVAFSAPNPFLGVTPS